MEKRFILFTEYALKFFFIILVSSYTTSLLFHIFVAIQSDPNGLRFAAFASILFYQIILSFCSEFSKGS